MSMNTVSMLRVRHTAVKPLRVAKADTPMKTNTTHDLRLPVPIRIKVLLPQPEAKTMPMPNRVPPSKVDNHSHLVVWYRDCWGSIWPDQDSRAKPDMAVAITKAHWRMRDQSPMLITSLKAPMVQKWVRCAMAPNATESAKQIHSTD
jgi:hypothetical protein